MSESSLTPLPILYVIIEAVKRAACRETARLTCFGARVIISGGVVDWGEFGEGDDDGADGSLASRFSRLAHERQASRRLPRRVADPHRKRQSVFGERSEHDVQLVFGLGNRNKVPGHLQILRLLVYHLREKSVNQSSEFEKRLLYKSWTERLRIMKTKKKNF